MTNTRPGAVTWTAGDQKDLCLSIERIVHSIDQHVVMEHVSGMVDPARVEDSLLFEVQEGESESIASSKLHGCANASREAFRELVCIRPSKHDQIGAQILLGESIRVHLLWPRKLQPCEE